MDDDIKEFIEHYDVKSFWERYIREADATQAKMASSKDFIILYSIFDLFEHGGVVISECRKK